MRIFKRRSWGELRVAAVALVALPVTRLALRWMALPGVRRRLWRVLGASQPVSAARRLPMGRIVRCVIAASKLSPVRPACLATALVVQALLNRHGYQTELKIGVRNPASGAFSAHAWLEKDGVIVVGGPASMIEQYQTLPAMEHLIA